MEISDKFFSFIGEHAADDLSQLLLSSARYPDVDVPFAVEQIAARRHVRDKLPLWSADGRLLFPSRTAAEQCSSELTARYKQRLLDGKIRVCDLTGGLGVDTYYFSLHAGQVAYIERDAVCFDTAMYNFKRLQADNIKGYCADAADIINEIPAPDVFYVDPSRRVAGNKRVFALKDCSPDLTVLMPELLRRAPRVIAKLSPMLDIRHTLGLLCGTVEIHVVAVKNECRELLFVAKATAEITSPEVHCVNFTSDGGEQRFDFILDDEDASESNVCDAVCRYLYEPNVSILKAGAFKLTAARYKTGKLNVNSHLYTSDNYLPDFPGRAFVVERVLPFNNAVCRSITGIVPMANVSVRNFPLTASHLSKRLGVIEGGDAYLFATTLKNGSKVLIICRKA